MQQIIHPETREEWLNLRTMDLTSTDVAALFGISPYLTKFELWHRKKEGNIVSIEENQRMRWGNLLESAIANGIAEEQGWTVRPMKEYIREDELRLGSSFDFSIEGKTKIVAPPPNENSSPVFADEPSGILEIKNVDGLVFKQQWIENKAGQIEAPLHIEIQVQHQLLVSGRSYAYIGCLVGGNNLVLLKRKRNEKVIEGIKIKAAEFWKSIEENNPPEPDFSVDAGFMCNLYNYAEPGKVVEADERIAELATNYKQYADAEKEAKKNKEAYKAQILEIIKDAEKVLGDGFSISAGTVGPAHIEYEQKGYRNFRVNWRKK